jgi:hypothetical protein
MKKLNTISILVSLLTLFSSGCYSAAGYYIGNYHIITEAAKDEHFRSVAKAIGMRIATELEYEVVNTNDERPGLEISLRCSKKDIGPRPNVEISWHGNQGWFNITLLKSGANENEEILRARKVVEKVLSEHLEFHWSFELTHRTMAK